MTVRSSSLVQFGQLLNTLAKSILGGVALGEHLGIVCERFGAHAVTLLTEGRADAGEPLLIVARGGGGVVEAASARERAAELAALQDECPIHCASDLVAGDSISCQLSVFRIRGSRPFRGEDVAAVNIVATHIGNALEAANRVDGAEVERALYSDLLDKLHLGVIIIDASGTIISTSPVAELFLAAREGLQRHAGKLRAANSAEDREFQAAIKGSGEQSPGGGPGASRGLALTKHSGARTLGVIVRPISSGAAGVARRVAVYVRDCDFAPEVESEFVRQIFDFTPAEAAVTRRLISGLSLEDTANSLAISRNTARSHLRSIFSKSGVTRQTELMRLVLSSAAIFGERPHQLA